MLRPGSANIPFWRLAQGLLLCTLAGCATMNASQCRVADWRLVGYQDGALGRPATAIVTYRKDCAEHGVVPDLDAWLAGRNEGLREYCKPANGFRLGQSGKGLNPVCPDDAAAAFRAAYAEGRSIYDARAEVNSTHSKIYKLRHTVDDLEQDKRDKLADLVRNGLQPDQRVLLLYEIHQIDDRIGSLRDRIGVLEQQLSFQQARLDRLSR